MNFVEALSPEYQNFLLIVISAIVVYLGWCTTYVREERHPTAVLIIDSNRRRFIDLQSAAETNARSQSSQSNYSNATEDLEIERDETPNDNLRVSTAQSLQSIIDEVNDLAISGETSSNYDTSQLQPLEDGIDELLEDIGQRRIIEVMDTSDPGAALRRRHLAFYDNDSNNYESDVSSNRRENLNVHLENDQTDNSHAENCTNENNENGFSKKIHHRGNTIPETEKLPVVYSSSYGVHFCGLQKLHPFDSAKNANVMRLLKEGSFLSENQAHKPEEVSEKELRKVHSKRYLKSLKWSLNVAKIAEIPILAAVPNNLVQRGYLRPMRFQTAGSILAGKLALQEGWAINLGGGFHHCSANKGGGFCPYADITLMIRMLMNDEMSVSKTMIVDLDAHQGNGHERDFMDDQNVFIMDMYNSMIYPKDHQAKLAIKCAVELRIRTPDEIYLNKLKSNLQRSLEKFRPDIIVYNAGTDILENDPLGLLSITPQGVIDRDEFVFSTAISKRIPIVMLLSGGYLKASASVIANSVMNLKAKGLLPVKM